MATLNTPISYGADDEDDEEYKSVQDSILTWNWATWPSNLRKAAITTGVIAALLAGAVTLARWTDQRLTKTLKTQTDIKTQAQTRLKNSDQERADIDKNIPLLRELEQRGIFGEEKRLEWIEQLRTIEKRWIGVKLQYDISTQNPLPDTSAHAGAPPNISPSTTASALPSGEAAQSFGVFQTDMKLTLKVLHEGDVLAVIEELKAAKLGLFTVKQCSFKRPGGAGMLGAQTGTLINFVIGQPLDAECVLTWISMKAYTPT